MSYEKPKVILTEDMVNLVKTLAIIFLLVTVVMFHTRIVVLEHDNNKSDGLRDKIILLEEKVSWTEDEILNLRKGE